MKDDWYVQALPVPIIDFIFQQHGDPKRFCSRLVYAVFLVNFVWSEVWFAKLTCKWSSWFLGFRLFKLSCCFLSVTGRNLTFCELQREINRAQSKDFIPGCTKDGEFEEVQCQLSSGVCWCVDKAGIEIPDSRTLGLPSCNLSDGKDSFLCKLRRCLPLFQKNEGPDWRS